MANWAISTAPATKPKTPLNTAKQTMPAVETFKNVPELFEGISEESIKTRTETMSKNKVIAHNITLSYLDTFKQLGPDDLVHVVKNIPNSRQQIKEVKGKEIIIC